MAAGFITLFALIALLPFRFWAIHRQEWRQLDPVEQNLRRASEGFAFFVLVLLQPFFLYGWRSVLHFLEEIFTAPGQVWPLLLIYAGLLAYGIFRFRIGMNRLQGVQGDGLRLAPAIIKFVLALLVFVYACLVFRAGRVGVTLTGLLALLLVLAASLWMVLTNSVRIFVLLRPQSSAYDMVSRHIAQEEFSWGEPPRRSRWRFRRRSHS